MRTEIRECAAAKIADALAVHRQAFAKHQSTYHARPEDAAKQASRLMEGVRGVAIDGERIVGTVQYVDHRKHIHVLGLAVHPDFQGKGIGRLLIDWVVERSADLGHDTLVTDTIEETGIVSFYEHLGFRIIERTVTLLFDSDVYESLHSVLLEKKLSNHDLNPQPSTLNPEP
jgi:GNAT superfamily N-acetyltransferase